MCFEKKFLSLIGLYTSVFKIIIGVALLFSFVSCEKKQKEFLFYIEGIEQSEVQYGIDKLQDELKKKGISFHKSTSKEQANFILDLLQTDVKEKNDGFVLQKKENQISISSEHSRGLLYGLLDVAEQLQQEKSWEQIQSKDIKAHYSFRAIKFNLPWFPYRGGENLALHYETCKDLKFWESFLDMMVENKFNVLSLWNLHPYMYMVQSEKFPEASPFTKEEMAEWKSFWMQLFKMSKDRGIEPYIFNWNIFVSEEFSKAYDVAGYSKEGGYWGDGETNESIEAYTREMVTKTINEYKNIAGIGITLGERMGGMTSEMRKDWIDRTLVQGVKDADRKVKLFYRAPLSAGLTSHGTVSKATEEITREAIENIGLEEDILLGFKFNWSHGHSSPKLSIVHGGILTDTYWNPKPENYKGVYTVRNEDFFALRWAQPDFIRDYLKYNSQDHMAGTIIGSETYIPAKDYITKKEVRSWNYAFEKQWLFYKAWGNLLYNKQTSDAYFSKALAKKYEIHEASNLLKAWKLASQNANEFASFYRGEWDATLYTEGMTHVRGKFIDVEKMISHPVLDSAYVNIEDFVARKFTNKQITPLQFAENLENNSSIAQQIVKDVLAKETGNALLKMELNDIIAWCYFGYYVASKVRGGVALQQYKVKKNKEFQEKAIVHLEAALGHWKNYVNALEKYNVEVMPYQFDANFSFRKHTKDVEKDISIAKKEYK